MSCQLFIINLLLIAIFTQFSQSVCRQSYVTVCENLKDLDAAKTVDLTSWTEIVIGAETEKPFGVVNLMDLNYRDFNSLKQLTIVNQIAQLEFNIMSQCSYNLQLNLKLYGNIMTTLKLYTFAVLHYGELNLRNNSIERVERNTFFMHEVDVLDLSFNQLDVIENGAFSPMQKLRVLILDNNKITHIEEDSVSNLVQVLSLNNNNLRHLDEEVLNKFTNLKELGLKNNKFTVIPMFQTLTSLKMFDFSRNKIGGIPKNMFEAMNELLVLDLSYNQIEELHFLKGLFHRSKPGNLHVSLIYNKVKDFELNNVRLNNEELSLFGNPWDCNNWDKIHKIIQKNQNRCDSQFFSSGLVPYCLNYSDNPIRWAISFTQGQNIFMDSIKLNEHLIKCDLEMNINKLLKLVSYGCVS